MPLPLFLGIGAAIAGAAGVGSGVLGATKMKKSNDIIKATQTRHELNVQKFEDQNEKTTSDMDVLGKNELEILDSFDKFSNVMAKIQNKPIFKPFTKDGVNLPEYNSEELKRVSVGAGVLLGGIGGAAAGTAGGFAAAGATTAAVMALGTASTGTAIATLSGAAATNAALAAIGGGAIAAGGGGMALGTTILGASTLGAGILIGGVIFNIIGSSISKKVNASREQMLKAEDEIRRICKYLTLLSQEAKKYNKILVSINDVYKSHINKMSDIINIEHKIDWNTFSGNEKLVVENTVLLVQILFDMCKLNFVIKSEKQTDINKVNIVEIDKTVSNAKGLLDERGLVV